MHAEQRVVITGMGVVSPIGTGKEQFCRSLQEGRSGTARICSFDPSSHASRVAGEVRDFDPDAFFSPRERRRMERFVQFAVVAAMMAVSDANVTPFSVAAFGAMKALSTSNDRPESACRPFDRGRDGFVIAEGAAVFVLETLAGAGKRGARVYAELAGFGCAADAYHATSPAPDARGMREAMEEAVREAGVSTEQIDYINAHGTGTKLNDELETVAIKRAFGSQAYRIPVSSTKSMTGHTLAAAGAVELAATLLAMERGFLPPTINYADRDPECDLDYVPNEARQARIRCALSNSFGFGGQNASVVLRSI